MAVGRQLEDCRALAGQRGWRVVEEYVDQDLSAYSGKTRPEYKRLLSDLGSGDLDAVVVWHVDRLHRQPRELEEFLDVWDAAGLTDLATVTGPIDLATHDGRFTARILGAVSKKESDDKSRRVRRKHQEIAAAGRVSGGGSRPFGYEPGGLLLRPDEAAVIRDCARRVLGGDSLRAVCADLTVRKVPTVSGGQWKTQTLRRVLLSGRISGQRDHYGRIVGPAVWPAIITPAETERLRAKLTYPARRTNKSARRYLLARLLRCGLCGATLVARPRADGTRRYVCATGPNFSGCGKITIVADSLEALVVESVLYRFDSPELAATLDGQQQTDAQGVEWQREAERAQGQLEELARAHGEELIGLQEWLAARTPIEQRLQTARRKLAGLNRNAALAEYIGDGSKLRSDWPELTLTRQAAIVTAVLDHVIVNPGRQGLNRLDPSRVTPVWRG